MPREYKRITFEDRKKIEKMHKEGLPIKYIAKLTGISQNKLYVELKRCKGDYNAWEAQKTVGGPCD